MTKKLENYTLPKILEFFAELIAHFFYVGKVKVAPGTAASLVTYIFYITLVDYKDIKNFGSVLLCCIGMIILIQLSLWVIKKYTDKYGVHDAKEIVIDEVVGQLIALLIVDFMISVFNLHEMRHIFLLLSFFGFRIFDIYKPGFIGKVDRKEYKSIDSYSSVLLDDILAGLYTTGVMLLICIVVSLHKTCYFCG